MVFEITCPTETLEELISYTLAISPEDTVDSRVCFAPKGIQIDVLDEKHIAALRLEAQKSTFTTYSSEDTHAMVLPHKKISAVLRLAKPQEEIRLCYDESNSEHIFAYLSNVCRKIKIDTHYKQHRFPSLQYRHVVKAKLDAKDFQLLVRSAESIGAEFIVFDFKDSGILFDAEGPEDRVSLNVPKEEMEICEGAAAKACFGVDYLLKFMSALTVPKIELNFGSDSPLEVRIPFYGFNNIDPTGKVDYALAPRIEKETEETRP